VLASKPTIKADDLGIQTGMLAKEIRWPGEYGDIHLEETLTLTF
jgi:hypothetical protein